MLDNLRYWTARGRIRPFGGTTRALILAGLIAFVQAAGATEPLHCGSERITIEAGSAELGDRICRAALLASEQVRACGFEIESDIRITVVPKITGLNGNPLACFKPGSQGIEVLDPKATVRAVSSKSAYALLPVDDLYDSLIVHEMTHAIFVPDGKKTAQTFVSQEYIASAFQFSSMDPDVRSILLDRFPRTRPVALDELNPFIAAVAPVRFGVNAWRHFAQPGNGCDMVRRITKGEVVFSASEP